MGGTTVDLEKTMSEPRKCDKDLVWPAEKFRWSKHGKFHTIRHVMAYNSLSQMWGFYNINQLRDAPTYVRPDKCLKPTERWHGFTTWYYGSNKEVRLHIFARLEPGMDYSRAHQLGKPVLQEHERLMKYPTYTDHMRAYRLCVQAFPDTMWQNYTFPNNQQVTNIYTTPKLRWKYLPDSDSESDDEVGTK